MVESPTEKGRVVGAGHKRGVIFLGADTGCGDKLADKEMMYPDSIIE